ncbi:MAG: hypothetical protein ACYCOO_09195 [Chitinophagaceae bacterium]
MSPNPSDMNMVKKIKPKGYYVYRILGVLNNLIAILFLFSVIANISVMGFFSSILVPLFLSVCLLIYTNLTMVFAKRVLAGHQSLKVKWMDWIRVNAYVTIGYAAILLLSMSTFLFNQQLSMKVMQMLRAQNSKITLLQLQEVAGFLLVCALSLIVHVLFTFWYLKTYQSYFNGDESQQLG